MKVRLASVHALRSHPSWQLLTAPGADLVLVALHAAFNEPEALLCGVQLHDRVAHALRDLQDAGEAAGLTAEAAVAAWLSEGWLARRGSTGAEAWALSDAACVALHVAGPLLADTATLHTPPATPAKAAPADDPAPGRGNAPPHAREGEPAAPRQLDIFADSDDVRCRNDFADAVLAGDADAAHRHLHTWQQAHPADALMADAAVLAQWLDEDRLSGELPEAASPASLLAARHRLERPIADAARALLGAGTAAWLSGCWRRLAERARRVEWHPAQADAHAASLWLLAGDGTAAAAAVNTIESWRRIPQPLLWMAEARWRAEGADAAWPLLAEACWLAPGRAKALLARQAAPAGERRLQQALGRFEEDFDVAADDETAWAWWPAWLAVDQPLLAGVLATAEDPPHPRPAAEGMRLAAALLRLEREGRHPEIVAARKRLLALEPRLFACYMRTR